MLDLLTIGRFAESTGLTVKALRLYDRLGLLRPVVVDFATGYRCYSPDRVTVGRQIRLLRSVHMSLADIRALLVTEDPNSVESQLTRHRQRITERIAGYEQALSQLPTADVPTAIFTLDGREVGRVAPSPALHPPRMSV